MKTKEAPDLDRIVDLTIEHPPFLDQATPFTISGLAIEQASTIQAAVEADYAKQDKEASVARKAVRTAVQAPEVPIYTEPTKTDRIKQWVQDSHVRKFDKQHGSNLYGELLEQRRRDALFLKASQIGLLGTDSMYYKRKLGQLSKV